MGHKSQDICAEADIFNPSNKPEMTGLEWFCLCVVLLGRKSLARGIINWDGVGLGTKPDGTLAMELNVAPSTVARQRKKRGIPPFGRKGFTRVNWDQVGLGVRPDTHIAEELGVSVAAVCIARNKRGIPPAPKETRNASGVSAVEAE